MASRRGGRRRGARGGRGPRIRGRARIGGGGRAGVRGGVVPGSAVVAPGPPHGGGWGSPGQVRGAERTPGRNGGRDRKAGEAGENEDEKKAEARHGLPKPITKVTTSPIAAASEHRDTDDAELEAPGRDNAREGAGRHSPRRDRGQAEQHDGRRKKNQQSDQNRCCARDRVEGLGVPAAAEDEAGNVMGSAPAAEGSDVEAGPVSATSGDGAALVATAAPANGRAFWPGVPASVSLAACSAGCSCRRSRCLRFLSLLRSRAAAPVPSSGGGAGSVAAGCSRRGGLLGGGLGRTGLWSGAGARSITARPAPARAVAARLRVGCRSGIWSRLRARGAPGLGRNRDGGRRILAQGSTRPSGQRT